MSPLRPHPRRILGKNYNRRRKVQDRVRENSVVRTFGPLSRSFSFELPSLVVQQDETAEGSRSELYAFPQSISTQDLTDDKTSITNDDTSELGDTTARNGWNSDNIQHRLLRSVARRDGDKVTLLVPLMPVYGLTRRDTGDAIRAWIRANTQDSRWSTPEMAARYLYSPARSTGTQTDPVTPVNPVITVTTSTPIKRVYEDGGDTPSFPTPSTLSLSSSWDRLMDVESAGSRLRASTPHKPQDLAGEGVSAECGVEGRGGRQVVSAGGRQVTSARRLPDPVEVEKVEGGGLSIQGVSLASNCHVTLCVFGVFFMLAGVVLSYVSYSVTLGANGDGTEGSDKGSGPEEHLASVSQMRMIGPAFLVVGFLMVGLGITLFALARKISRDEKVKQLVISEQQLCELESSFSYSAASPMHTNYPAPNQPYPILAVRRNSWWVDSMPREAVEAQDSAIQCPSPIEGFVPDAYSPSPENDEEADNEGVLTEVRSDIPTLYTAAQEIRPTSTLSRLVGLPGAATPPRLVNNQDLRAAMLKPSSAAQTRSHGVPVPTSAGQIPSIQVTAATPILPPLPRLSRHHSSRPDSRPTTADSR
ncbi:hypothetical protein GWK47_007923 [Chionoecetes opilio]|uniref:Transmembrane protein n=1 Tax=Chionoecetes opilio TaxID=41210 RepID=A0A8J5CQL1_CHIOP|nr:hypothetical protein GWK47_007923 [Chionoecetes opilio]